MVDVRFVRFDSYNTEWNVPSKPCIVMVAPLADPSTAPATSPLTAPYPHPFRAPLVGSLENAKCAQRSL